MRSPDGTCGRFPESPGRQRRHGFPSARPASAAPAPEGRARAPASRPLRSAPARARDRACPPRNGKLAETVAFAPGRGERHRQSAGCRHASRKRSSAAALRAISSNDMDVREEGGSIRPAIGGKRLGQQRMKGGVVRENLRGLFRFRKPSAVFPSKKKRPRRISAKVQQGGNEVRGCPPNLIDAEIGSSLKNDQAKRCCAAAIPICLWRITHIHFRVLVAPDRDRQRSGLSCLRRPLPSGGGGRR